ncbi:hypothetical protein L2E82_33624 [Cichorium intybus]|uniref:Uncharacterized protein n=1 Tax=Cichorium intybus TaxID=13427 RepID=A0ACB9BKN0_CICIN|nr:hypothetical protein L2E82_33624 [Cichorium intybus]
MGSGFLLSRHQIPSSSTSGTLFRYGAMTGVLINKVSISSPKLSPNTDGIHIENTKSVERPAAENMEVVAVVQKYERPAAENMEVVAVVQKYERHAAENMEVVAVVQKYGEGN